MLTLPPQTWLSHSATQQLLGAFEQAGFDIRFVGGCVRDALMGRIVKDVDACTPALPQQVIELLEAANIKAIPTGIDHGTITAIIDHHPYEITTLRKDTACDGRHAEVEFTDSWEEDAQRRDFTMNALYCNGQGEVFDPIGGIADAQQGNVQFIGKATDRIQEDGLRILRFFRFLATHAKHPASEDALHACITHRDMLQDLSGERIQQEMLKLLGAPDPRTSLNHMMPDILPLLIPSIEKIDALDHVLAAEQSLSVKPNAITRLASLVLSTEQAADLVKPIQQHWKLSNADVGILYTLTTHPLIETDALESTLKATLRHLGKDRFVQLILLSWHEDELQVLDVAYQLAQTWQPPIFPVNGADLIGLGYESGPQMGVTLKQLEALWESMDYTMNKEQLLGTLKQN